MGQQLWLNKPLAECSQSPEAGASTMGFGGGVSHDSITAGQLGWGSPTVPRNRMGSGTKARFLRDPRFPFWP